MNKMLSTTNYILYLHTIYLLLHLFKMRCNKEFSNLITFTLIIIILFLYTSTFGINMDHIIYQRILFSLSI